jgi:polysaccharide pyruvyl transferase WcaK-like protein
LLPRLLGVPLMKYSQALGPFQRPLNRMLACRLLPHVDVIAARGWITLSHLQQLGIPERQLRQCADAAFAMRISEEAEAQAAPLVTHPVFQRPVVCVAPSSQVDTLCRRSNLDYCAQLAEFLARHVIERGDLNVLIIAHSARPGKTSTKNNDLPVCRALVDRVAMPNRCHFSDKCYGAEALRYAIGQCRYLIASRFHAMVSGLAMGIPCLLVGWSHKYQEVLEQFGMDQFALDYSEVSADSLQEWFARLRQEDEMLRQKIAEHLPQVIESSLENARLAATLAKSPVAFMPSRGSMVN